MSGFSCGNALVELYWVAISLLSGIARVESRLLTSISYISESHDGKLDYENVLFEPQIFIG